MKPDELDRPPHERDVDPTVIAEGHDYNTVADRIADPVLVQPTGIRWFMGFGIAFFFTMVMFMALGYLVIEGTGIWGINIPIGWGFAIVNFVWWIGIGHAGTLISAILLLLRQDWRTSINRFAEAMTLFAVACAGLFPVAHTGRPWLAYWLLPYPNTMNVWPQPRSPLIWDVFAVTTYLTVSFLFWFVGLIPDFATMRDRATKRWQQVTFAILSFGWRGSARHWARYEMMYLLLAGLATPLVISVHTVVSFDFAIAQVPGWHTTIFPPPYFVAGAIHSGFAMVMTLAIPARAAYKLKDFITMRHLQNMAKLMIATGWIVAYGYIMEIFMAWYSGTSAEWYMVTNRMTGPYAPLYWALWVTNIIAPQFFWIRYFRTSIIWLFVLSIIINIGMWLERFVIVITSLHRDFVPSSWGMYYPTRWDVMTFLGTIGFFLTLMFLFMRFLPSIAIFEIRAMVPPPPERPEPGRQEHDVPAREVKV